MRAKTGGRQKGTPNKRSVEALEVSSRLQIDPFEILLLFAKGDAKALGYAPKSNDEDGTPKYPEIDQFTRQRAAAEACKYLYPQTKSMKLTTDDEGFKIVIEDYRQADGT